MTSIKEPDKIFFIFIGTWRPSEDGGPCRAGAQEKTSCEASVKGSQLAMKQLSWAFRLRYRYISSSQWVPQTSRERARHDCLFFILKEETGSEKGPAQGQPVHYRWSQGENSGSSPGLSPCLMSLGVMVLSRRSSWL